MGLTKENKITAEFVLSKVDDANIFNAYFGPFNLRKSYSSVFRRDSNPSTGFYVNKSGKLVYSDLATGERYDCFSFVAKKYGITYGNAIYKVACDFGLVDCSESERKKYKVITREDIGADIVKKDKLITIIRDKWSPVYMRFWEQFGITREELEREEVYPVRKLFIDGTLIPNYEKQVRYGYVLNVHGKSYKKIYSPYSEKGNYKWITNIPLRIPFGINKLPFKSNQLVITKSQKDRIILQKYFTDVIAMQNESPQALDERTRTYLEKRYDSILFNQDLDEAGVRSTEYFVQFGYTPFTVPSIAKEKHGIKDFAEFVAQYGLKRFEDYLKHLNLI